MATGDECSHRDESPFLLSPLSAWERGQQFQQGRQGTLSHSHLAGLTPSWPTRPGGRRPVGPVFGTSASDHRWSLASGERVRDFHTGSLDCSRPSTHARGAAPCQDDGQGQGLRPPSRTWRLWPAKLESWQRKLEQQWLRRRSRQLERERKERQGIQRQGQCLERPAGAWRFRPGGLLEQGAREREEGRDKVEGLESDSALLEAASCLADIGLALWFLIFRSREPGDAQGPSHTPPDVKPWWKKVNRGLRVTRTSRALFPLPSIWEGDLEKVGSWKGFLPLLEDIEMKKRFSLGCWCELSVLFCNRLFDGTQGFAIGPPTKAQLEFLRSIESQVKRILNDDVKLCWSWEDVVSDFKKKNLSYTGEEVCKAEKLSAERISPALPPEGHGGCIRCIDWVDGKTKALLLNPRSCVVPDTGQKLPRLQAKMHFEPGESLNVARLLVKRNICRWVPSHRVLTYRNEKVLNGMFGVPKSKLLPSGKTTLRTIMNLIPSNAVLREIPGRISKLPNICQWLQVCMADGEELSVCQSDMTSAFYLFSLPHEWSELLCFNLWQRGEEIGLGEGIFYLGCNVLPMGWSSATGVMQYIAEKVLHDGGLPQGSQITKTSGLPPWVIDSWNLAEKEKKPWWHVYLDNYASGEKVSGGFQPMGDSLQQEVEELWRKAGILSSQDKSVTNAKEAQELGAYINGKSQWIGASPERLVKLCKATMWLANKPSMKRKTLQILMGRWNFAMQFRRPYMSHFQSIWRMLSWRRPTARLVEESREELVFGLYGLCLMHTWLGLRIDETVMCSDASLDGGAVAIAKGLRPMGKAFLSTQRDTAKAQKIPVLLISLFNGIGGARRSYDVAGVEPAAMIVVDVHKPANRVSTKRWPTGTLWLDVRSFTKETIEALVAGLEECEEIHVWAGFPCVDLSSAKALRRNLEGQSSGLIHEAIRILADLRECFPHMVIHFVVENVASMDNTARDEISELLGVTPYRVDPIRQVPLSRPRFCWTSLKVFEVEGLSLVQKVGYTDMVVEGTWPAVEDWIDEGSIPFEENVIYPCCMKSIRRTAPPFRPAGIERCDEQTLARWTEDEYRFPPYQYKGQYLIWDNSLHRGRLLSITERERLLGYGTNHTELAYSASEAKQRPALFKDERMSLLGDSFSIYSFMCFACFAAYPWTKDINIGRMNRRTGLPPGYALNARFEWPLASTERVPDVLLKNFEVRDLNAWMLSRTNHTGSDVRLLSGSFLNPKAYPRESVRSCWWQWDQLFHVRWEHTEHINPLEVRAIFLSILWRARNLCLANRRVFNVTDSYVGLSILAKGRTSSQKLQPIVRKVCAMLLAAQTILILGHVDSADNPTDEGSRVHSSKKAS